MCARLLLCCRGSIPATQAQCCLRLQDSQLCGLKLLGELASSSETISATLLTDKVLDRLHELICKGEIAMRYTHTMRSIALLLWDLCVRVLTYAAHHCVYLCVPVCVCVCVCRGSIRSSSHAPEPLRPPILRTQPPRSPRSSRAARKRRNPRAGGAAVAHFFTAPAATTAGIARGIYRRRCPWVPARPRRQRPQATAI